MNLRLTDTIWSWFAAAESHNRLSQNQAGMIQNQGLSYGLFHAIAQPVYSWGVARKVTFPGVNMDIGHVRPIGWSKDNDKATWVAYNKLRGQYMSALEHAIPERFFNDPAQCNPEGATTFNPALQPCPQGISAVKAIGLAAAQGQKIYTITKAVYQANPNIVSSQLFAHSYSTQQAVQNALDVGHEVTIHEKLITQSGWTGAGYTTIDPETGAGGYMIEGGSNGGFLSDDVALYLSFIALIIGVLGIAGAIIAAVIGLILLVEQYLDMAKYSDCPGYGLVWLTHGLSIIGLVLGLAGAFIPILGLVATVVGLALFWIGWALGAILPMLFENATCRK